MATGLTIPGWNTFSMTSLCTSACESFLAELANAVETGCGSATFTFDSQNITFAGWVDHMQCKVGLICLADTDTSDYCLDVEKTYVTQTFPFLGG